MIINVNLISMNMVSSVFLPYIFDFFVELFIYFFNYSLLELFNEEFIFIQFIYILIKTSRLL